MNEGTVTLPFVEPVAGIDEAPQVWYCLLYSASQVNHQRRANHQSRRPDLISAFSTLAARFTESGQQPCLPASGLAANAVVSQQRRHTL